MRTLPFSRSHTRPAAAASDKALMALRVAVLAAVLALSNGPVLTRISVLLTQQRLMPLVVLAAIYGAALTAMVLMLFDRSRAWRGFWGAVLGLAGASAYAFQTASGSEMTVFDALSMLEAAHEGGRAAAAYSSALIGAAGLGLATLTLYLMPLKLRPLPRLVQWPARGLPLALIAAVAWIIIMKQGGGAQGLPKQISQVSIMAVAGLKSLAMPAEAREAVAWTPASERSVSKIVMLVDESIRADYLDLTRSDGPTPALAALSSKLVDFGPAASGGVCSNTSNAILRFAAARRDLGKRLASRPTLWQFAKRAGYRTVFIDAQARNVGGGGLQNFMTMAETRDIDKIYRIEGDPSDADEKLRQIVVDETAGDKRVFIYANKEGGHFPYDINYPPGEALYHPTQTEASAHTMQTNVNSYRNAVHWNVNRFMERLFAEADTSDMALVYTSDHGQQLDPGRLTHCLSADADPRMAFVPLLTFTSDPALTQALRAGAWQSKGKANHFQIAPSLIAFMGYGARDIESHYGESLTMPPKARPQFTTGDIMGLFAARVMWNDIDLDAHYLETPDAVAAVQ